MPLKQSGPRAFQCHGIQLCSNMLCLSKHPLGTPKGPRFKSFIMEVFRNHTKPPKRQWISIFLLRQKKKKKKLSTHCKWENDTSHIVTENGSINPSFQNYAQRY